MEFKPANLKRKSPSKVLCKYGASCYQKNPEHHKKYRHPESSEEKPNEMMNSAKTEDTKPFCEDKIKKKTLVSESQNSTIKNEETVGDVLKNMPIDFFDFWEFCSTLHKSNPEEALSAVGFHLVGVYDLLSKELPNDNLVKLHCHWRYYYDPPEFQTVIKQDGDALNHIGYFRDDPAELPSILASNAAALGPKFILKGDNIFAAVNFELMAFMKKLKKKELTDEISNIHTNLKKFAKKRQYSLEIQTAKTKARNKKTVTKSFHGLGIVVPVTNDVGYRSLPESDATLKSILQKILDAESESERLEKEESLDEILTNLQFANDECDYGMGLELGIDLFCFGHPYFHPQILSFLPLAYELLKRPKYGEIIKAHLAKRRKGNDLNDIL